MSSLKKYCLNLNQEYKNQNSLLIGRESELNAIMQTLCRMNKNNPLLLGEAGVGKTSLVYGLARKINEGTVPSFLRGSTIYMLSINGLVAGTKVRGALEERLQEILQEASDPSNKAILFIDEIHMIYKNSVDLNIGDIFKPYLSHSHLRCIGATTFSEYVATIEKDRALRRRFNRIMVEEPTVNESIAIIRGIKHQFENYYGVTINDDAVSLACKLAKRHMFEQHLPDSAIDIINDTSSRMFFNLQMIPEEIMNIGSEVDSLKLELESLKIDRMHSNVSDINSELLNTKIQDLKRLIDEKNAQFLSKKTMWEQEKNRFNAIKNLNNEKTRILNETQTLRRSGDFASAGKLLYVDLPVIEQKIADLEALNKIGNVYISDYIGTNEIIKTVSKKTGIPTERFVIDKNTLARLEEFLMKNILGQENVIKKVCAQLSVIFSGFISERGPLCSMLFIGGTGVGKTELASYLSQFLFGKDAFLRLDMSEFSEKYTISTLLGSAPGYIGYESDGLLTGPVRRRPHRLILIDEIEKAHPAVHSLFLQILDNGYITDRAGRQVSFRNSIIIMTSNSTDYISYDNSLNDETRTITNADLVNGLQKIFTTEFLNRFNDLILFDSLNSVKIKRVIALHLDRIIEKYNYEQGFLITYDPEVLEFLANITYNESLGAREVIRNIYRYIIQPVAYKIQSSESRIIHISVVDNDIYVSASS